MVELVDPSKFTRPVASGESNVVSIAPDNRGEILKAGGSLLGDIAGNLITREQADRRNTLDDADTKAAIALNDEQSKYNDDPDYTTIPDRANKSITDNIGKIAEGIKNPRDREIFMRGQSVNIAKTQEHLKGVAFAKERDNSRATIDTQLSDLRNVALTGDMGQASELVSRRLDSAVAKGYFGAEEAAATKNQWQVSAATGRLSMLPPEQQLGALDTPWAKNLPVDEQVKLRKVAEEQLVVGKAQSFTDGLMSKNVSLDQGMIDIQNKIKDPRERQATEERFKLQYTVAKAAKEDNQNNLHDKYSLMVEKGTSIDELRTKHSAEWDSMRPTQRQDLINTQAQRNAPPASSDPAALARVIELSANGRHDDVIKMINNNSSAFSKADREQYLTAAEKGKAVKNVSDQELLLAKIPDKNKKPQRDAMLVEMNQWRNDFVQSQGKDPTPDQTEKQVDRLLMNYDKDPSSMGWSDTKPVWKYDHEEQMKALDTVHRQELKDQDPENYDATENYAKEHGLKPDRYQFEELYKTQQLVTSIQRRDPVGYSDVLDYFNPNRDVPGVSQKVFPTKHPMVDNGDGTKSNVLLSGVNIDGKEYVIPTMVDGKKLSVDEAVKVAKDNGLNKYPSFASAEEGDRWAKLNHGNIDENGMLNTAPDVTPTHSEFLRAYNRILEARSAAK